MNVVFRADASEALGAGHLARCLVLAGEISKRGGTCQFLIRNRNAVACRVLENCLHETTSLDLPDTCDPIEDARRCAHYVQGVSTAVDWLIVDHYGLDARWEDVFRSMRPSVLVIDDLANRSHQCDVLVDPGMGREAADYAGWIPAQADTLIGSRYAILNPSFALHHAGSPLWPMVRRAHVFFGGGASARWLPACVEMLMKADATMEIFALGFCDEQAMTRLHETHGPRLSWSRYEADMIQHYERCSVAFGSPGAATWERACMGLPSAVMATAENQIPILMQLDQLGLCRYMGPVWEWDEFQLIEWVRSFLQDDTSRASMRATGLTSIDGLGAERIVLRLIAKGQGNA